MSERAPRHGRLLAISDLRLTAAVKTDIRPRHRSNLIRCANGSLTPPEVPVQRDDKRGSAEDAGLAPTEGGTTGLGMTSSFEFRGTLSPVAFG
ncbi:hypothetical protein CTAM01_03201 [Colletotrichum tamarilloi]|uniref:Uncharacterized protein n=1 Tax=Colletotrichum tamarilloi TaxID=1209934 RepID=A0ABQ9RLC3_9PEZI|nr:uncharacterized protein CTAM01_03201 [Colletotrichum tamarilloi]KAK1506869.1 hypothetical protein CTAM01_03201 [Colletotrichum tamarilloi]